MKKSSLIGNLMLILTALIWGGAFVAQSEGMDHVGALTFNSVRFFIGAAVLVPVMLISRVNRKKRGEYVPKTPKQRRGLWIAGLTCSLALGFAACVQQYAIIYTTVGKAGFITALYIIIVPIYSIFFGHRPSAALWLSVAVAAVGLYFLCITEGFSISIGDGLAMICSALFALQIMLVAHFAPRYDSVELSCIQFIGAAVIAGIGMLIFERPTFSSLLDAKWSLLYTGVLSSGVAYTLQTVGQKRTNPVVASLLMSLESVFAALFGALLLSQFPSAREVLGCFLVFAAIVLAQVLPTEHTKKIKKGEN